MNWNLTIAAVAISLVTVAAIGISVRSRIKRGNDFKRIRSLPRPISSSGPHIYAASTTTTTRTMRESRSVVNRVSEQDPTLPLYNRTDIAPPPPVYNPSSPPGHSTLLPLSRGLGHSTTQAQGSSAQSGQTPQSPRSSQPPTPPAVTFPMSRPPTVTPYISTPPPSIPPSSPTLSPSAQPSQSTEPSSPPSISLLPPVTGSNLEVRGPSPQPSTRPPSYRSNSHQSLYSLRSHHSFDSSSTIRPGMVSAGTRTLGAPPRYEVAMAR